MPVDPVWLSKDCQLAWGLLEGSNAHIPIAPCSQTPMCKCRGAQQRPSCWKLPSLTAPHPLLHLTHSSVALDGDLEPQMVVGSSFHMALPGLLPSPCTLPQLPPLPSTQALPTINSFLQTASKHKSTLDRTVGKASSKLAPKSHVVRRGLSASPDPPARPPSAPTARPGAGAF